MLKTRDIVTHLEFNHLVGFISISKRVNASTYEATNSAGPEYYPQRALVKQYFMHDYVSRASSKLWLI